jgi:alginate O-acetyltransferase complex protein AlgI
MLFTQIEFFVLFAAVFTAVILVKNHRAQKAILLVASYYFYSYWDWRFAGLLFSCTAINWWLAARMVQTESQRTKKILICLSVGYSLTVLGFFKYFNFFVDSFRALAGIDPDHSSTLDIILPAGISFYTFHTLSYTIDVYRGKLKTCKRLSDFALYVAFFPQLVAGPIVRASEFLPQLETPRTLSWARAYDGFRQFTLGLFKKVFIADRIAAFVDPGFENADSLNGITLWLVVIAYAVQIYCDFSGYSDMAIGIARTMGYDFSRNFDHPYLATSIQDFWRRWHISLSSWLRDYLYVPLGGNRHGPFRTYLNLFLTMVLGGLWHGANWTFVIWGAWHGIALAFDRLLTGKDKGSPPHALTRRLPGFLRPLLGWALTMLIVLVGWVFFRSPDVETALSILGRMASLSDGIAWYHPFAIGILLFIAGYHALLAAGKGHWFELKPDTIRTPAILLTLIWLVIAYYPREFQPFIYFQF